MSLNYTYREVEMLQLFAKRAEVEEIEKLLKIERYDLDEKYCHVNTLRKKHTLDGKLAEVVHISNLLKEEKKRIMAKIKQCQKQVEEGR